MEQKEIDRLVVENRALRASIQALSKSLGEAVMRAELFIEETGADRPSNISLIVSYPCLSQEREMEYAGRFAKAFLALTGSPELVQMESFGHYENTQAKADEAQ